MLKNYSSDEMDFAFSAERSIEDGIDEISQAELPTVVISYAVMFIYIAIALGKIRSFRYLMVRFVFERKRIFFKTLNVVR